MKERQILMSAPMVRAILGGSKTQTRRVMNPQPEFLQVYKHRGELVHDSSHRSWCWKGKAHGRYPDEYKPSLTAMCPYGQPGDVLWVREAHYIVGEFSEVFYRATGDSNLSILGVQPALSWSGPWRPSIHMPRWASRIDLRITGVRVEMLQDISDADCIAEGTSAIGVPTTPPDMTIPRAAYKALWESINGAGSWDANPWVWVVEFERIKP